MIRTLLGILSLLLLAPPLAAQEREIERSSVPRDLADHLIGIVNDPQTVRVEGEHWIAADSLIAADLLVMGSLRLGGRVEGVVLVVGGSVDLEPGAEITGDLVVVGGDIRGDEGARVGGTLMAFQPAGNRIPPVFSDRASADPSPSSVGVQRRFDREGSVDFEVGFGDYNRVEGLPIAFGPGFTTRGRNPLRTDAVMIVRTEGKAPYQTDRLGYRIEAEQFLGGRREFRVGGGLFSIIDPIESWGLTDAENALSTFLFTSDQRDYYEARGGHAYLRVTPRRVPIDLRIGIREERFGSVAPQDPWTLIHRGHSWRSQPLVAEGRSRSLEGQFGIDTRDNLESPRSGWLIQATWKEGIAGQLTLPAATTPGTAPDADPIPIILPDLDAKFSSAFLDLRHYASVGGGNALHLRALIGGSPNGEPLPPQEQLTLGGPGTLPGYSPFAGDCGARNGLVVLEREELTRTMVSSYGCDRVAFFQAEYRGSLSGFFGWDNDGAGPSGRGDTLPDPRWVVFFDAGKGWAEGDWGGLLRTDTPTLYDAGLGILLGGIGIYWAKPFGDLAGESTFTVRLGRRF